MLLVTVTFSLFTYLKLYILKAEKEKNKFLSNMWKDRVPMNIYIHSKKNFVLGFGHILEAHTQKKTIKLGFHGLNGKIYRKIQACPNPNCAPFTRHAVYLLIEWSIDLTNGKVPLTPLSENLFICSKHINIDFL